MRIYKIVGIVLSAILLLASCTNSDLEKKKVKIAYANWLEGIAMSHLAKVVLEEHGYEVELQNADLAPIFVSMSGKKSDVFLDAWLPITMKDYMDQYGDSIEFLGEVYGEARVGLVVPQYVTIQSISELEANKDRFSSEIVGIDAGAGIMKTTDKAIAAYGLDGYTLMTSSSSTMLASLKKAMDKGEWIVITGWTPHWMFDQFDLKFLDDPKKVYGDLEEIHAIAWKGFSEKELEIARTETEKDLVDINKKLDLFEERVKEFQVPTLNERSNSPVDYCKLYRERYMPQKEKSLALGAKVTYLIPPTGKYAALGKNALVDGLFGGATFVDSWIGWEGTDGAFVIDLGETKEIQSVETDFLHQIGAWILFPLKVVYSYAEDGEHYTHWKTIDLPEERTGEVKFRGVKAESAEPIKTRYVKVEVTGTKECPTWHYGVGHPSWFFIDEVIIK